MGRAGALLGVTIGRMGLRFICLLLLSALAAPALAAGDAVAGKRVFAKCASCHQVGPTARSSFGPQLNGIVGRKAAAAPDYRYSQAMRQSGIVWSEGKLRAFLKSPDKVVPGTNMRFWGIGNDAEIDDLLAYLRSAQ